MERKGRLEEPITFEAWLVSEKNMSQRSANDVLSRLRRAGRIVDIDVQRPSDETIYLLSRDCSFAAMSRFVKSQLKRAVKLYLEYQAAIPESQLRLDVECDV